MYSTVGAIGAVGAMGAVGAIGAMVVIVAMVSVKTNCRFLPVDFRLQTADSFFNGCNWCNGY